MHAFLIEHKPTQKLFMFDLGMRNDPQNLPPAFAGFFSSNTITFDAFKDITQLLQDGGVSLDSIDAVFWSHAHFDHIGKRDMSKFPNSTQIVVGATTDLSLFPQSPNSDLQASDLAGHNVIKLDFDSAKLTFGGMKAIDQFGDGSFYLLDSPGHLTGHMSALARVTPSSFIVLGGDTLHHVGQLRPSGAFQATVPCPGELLADARSAISTDFFWSAKTTPGAFDLPSRTQPFFALSDLADSFYVDPVAATVSVDKLAAFDADADFFTIIAHDRSILSTLPYFPASLSTWQADGLKGKTAWLFVDPTNPAFLLSPASANSSSLEAAYAECVAKCSATDGMKMRRAGMDWDTLMLD
ncbi:hypothetical protein B0H12DRAFT_1190546 [Mycena haematopus]|nr:hypothetical protein B0H12DRAFT_1190546 [Mycena haematopus]